MTAQLQNPDNWPGIMDAARELKGKLPELEREVGIHGEIGPIDDPTHVEVERLLDGGIPRTIEPEDVVVHDFRDVVERMAKPYAQRDLSPSPTLAHIMRDVPLSDREAMDRILTESKDDDLHPRKTRTLRWLGRSLLKRFGFMAMLAGAPIPQLQLQHCKVTMDGPLATIRCDSSEVCPPGYVLNTELDHWPIQGWEMEKVLGYGEGITNRCEIDQGRPRRVMELTP